MGRIVACGRMDMLCCSPRSGSNLLERSGLFSRNDEEYEVRVIVWEARAVATAAPKAGKHVSVRVQPRGKVPGNYQAQQTDEGPCNAKGDAEFNWRMLWPMSVLEKAPSLYIAVSNYGSNEMIGETEISLEALCERAAKRRTGQFLDTWVTLTAPGKRGLALSGHVTPCTASVCITVEVSMCPN